MKKFSSTQGLPMTRWKSVLPWNIFLCDGQASRLSILWVRKSVCPNCSTFHGNRTREQKGIYRVLKSLWWKLKNLIDTIKENVFIMQLRVEGFGHRRLCCYFPSDTDTWVKDYNQVFLLALDKIMFTARLVSSLTRVPWNPHTSEAKKSLQFY